MAKVIVADDDAESCSLLAQVLRDAGHHVYKAGDGKEALDFFILSSPDAVITDIEMPYLNGHELITEIRKTNPQILLIAVSGSDGAVLSTAKLLGANVCLAKPFDCFELVDWLTSILKAPTSTHPPCPVRSGC